MVQFSIIFGNKRSLDRFLYDRAWAVTSTQDNLQKVEHNLSDVLRQNGYQEAFIRSSFQPPRQVMEDSQGPPPEEGYRPPLVVLPHAAGEHQDASQRRMLKKSVVAKRAHNVHYSIR